MKEVITLTGPTCSGKSTMEKYLVESGKAVRATSHTTRSPRHGEVDGKDYYFVAPEKFQEMQQNNEFVETAVFGGHAYGVSIVEMESRFATELPVILVVEPDGLSQIANWAAVAPDVAHIPVYVTHSPYVLAERFVRRSAPDFAVISMDESKQRQFANRIAAMMTVERKWDEIANGRDPFHSLPSYKLVIHQGGEDLEADTKNIFYALGQNRRKERKERAA